MSLTDMAAAPGGTLAVFDVCDTLYRENTTVGFLDYFHHRNGTRSYFRRKALLTSGLSPPAYVAAAALRYLHRDWARSLLIRSLRGRSRAELESAAADYVAQELGGKANVPLIAALEEHRRQGDRLILLSSSLDIIVARIARLLATDWRASKLGFDSADRCTGKLVEDLTGRKHALASSLARTAERLVVYTDNLSDRALVEAADTAHVVIPRGRSRQSWEQVSADFIQL